MLRAWIEDVPYAVRQLRKSPGITALVVLTVAMGVGANTAVFSMVDGFLHPLPVTAPEQLVVLAARTKGDDLGLRYRLSYAALQDFRAQATDFSEIFGYSSGIGGLSADGKVTQFLDSAVTGNLFPALGIKPALGRLFVRGEGEKQGEDVLLVLGYSFWQKRFGGDPNVIGRQVRVSGMAARIVGVVPKEFHGLYGGLEMDGYLTLNCLPQFDRPEFRSFMRSFETDRNTRTLTVLGRLKPGIPLAHAQGSIDVITRRLEEQYPATDKGIGIHLVPEILARPIPIRFLEELLPVIRGFLLLLAALVLLLACMNVVNILLVRATVRQREMAIRAALGSGRSRLLVLMLSESLLLALLGGASGIVLGKWACDAFRSSLNLGTELPIVVDFSFDWRVFCYALVATIAAGILIGTWPALRASRAEAGAVLHDGVRRESTSGRQRVRGALVVAQVAGSLILLVVAGLCVRSLQQAQRVNLGFEADGLLTARVDPSQVGYGPQRADDFFRELKRRAQRLPGVQSATMSHSIPLGYVFDGTLFYQEGSTLAPGEQVPLVECNAIDPDYFDTMRIPVVRGRAFRESDTAEAPRVAIVNETMARRYWPNQDAIGKRFRTSAGGRFWEVAGIARDSKYIVLFEDRLPFVYFPLAQMPYTLRSIEVRSTASPQQLKAALQREIQSLDPAIPVADLLTMRETMEGGMGFLLFRIGAVQAGGMGVLGLVLAVIGVYGVVSYGASQRTREIGIRMALGAEPGDVRSLILGHGLRLVVMGVVAGLAGAAVMGRVATRFVLLVSSTDPVAFMGVTLALAIVALWACYLPARRAMHVDPMVALRHE